MYKLIDYRKKVHRIIPSKYPPVTLFDWADSKQELEEIALLEGLTNDRLANEYGNLNLVSSDDWVSGDGATPLMAAFTHVGYPSRFCDNTFGVYYAADSQETAVVETKFHRERFYSASNEPSCKITMREYIATVRKPLIDITNEKFSYLLNPDINKYNESQQFGRKLKDERQWGIYYPSVRREKSRCVAILRPPAVTIPLQGAHFEYFWDGYKISEVKKISNMNIF